MRNLFLGFLIAIGMIGCKKEKIETRTYDVQFHSNASNVGGIETLTINGETSEINKAYALESGSQIMLSLTQDTSTTWLSATIYVDGNVVESDAGYKNISLSYTIK
ncbi:MAG: hypothetical protein M3R27_08895 [Bacteroidota bacterium]|nr:hypothetical protein [Bacteroidota bacterium]